MHILDRYILKSITLSFLLCLIVFIFLYIIVDLFGHLDEIIRSKVDLLTLKDYYLACLSIIFIQTSPIATLLAVLFSLGRLSRDNEIIALRASGLSNSRILRIVFVFGLLISIVVWVVNERFVPKMSGIAQSIKKESFKKKESKSNEIKNVYLYGLENRLFFIERFLPQQELIEGITILQHDKYQNLVSKIMAEKGLWSKEKGWKFYQCQIFNFNEFGQMRGEPLFFEERLLGFPESPQDFLHQSKELSFMDSQELNDYIKRLSESGASSALRSLKVELYQRFAFPFTSLVVIFAGIPLALKFKKGGITLISLALCITIGFLFYVTYAVSLALGKAGILPPLLSAYLSHLIFVSMGIALFKNLP